MSVTNVLTGLGSRNPRLLEEAPFEVFEKIVDCLSPKDHAHLFLVSTPIRDAMTTEKLRKEGQEQIERLCSKLLIPFQRAKSLGQFPQKLQELEGKISQILGQQTLLNRSWINCQVQSLLFHFLRSLPDEEFGRLGPLSKDLFNFNELLRLAQALRSSEELPDISDLLKQKGLLGFGLAVQMFDERAHVDLKSFVRNRLDYFHREENISKAIDDLAIVLVDIDDRTIWLEYIATYLTREKLYDAALYAARKIERPEIRQSLIAWIEKKRPCVIS